MVLAGESDFRCFTPIARYRNHGSASHSPIDSRRAFLECQRDSGFGVVQCRVSPRVVSQTNVLHSKTNYYTLTRVKNASIVYTHKGEF